jgi:hypothetical protein
LVSGVSFPVHEVKETDNHFSLTSGIGDLGRFWLSCLGPLVLISPNTLNCLAFQSFDFKST